MYFSLQNIYLIEEIDMYAKLDSLVSAGILILGQIIICKVGYCY